MNESKEEIALALTVLETVREGTYTMEELVTLVEVSDDLRKISEQSGIPFGVLLGDFISIMDEEDEEE